ncbi:MAG: SDR family NAD(P)-dependent oxidoreductase, partial [Bdellovibrionota bacterium]
MNKEKFIIVTGATRGLGLGCVESLLSKGHRVLATGRDSAKVRERIPAKLGEKLLTEDLDVSSFESLTNFETKLAKITDRIDVLINNAGIFVDQYGGATLATPVEDLEKTLKTNVMGPYRLSQILIPFLK